MSRLSSVLAVFGALVACSAPHEAVPVMPDALVPEPVPGDGAQVPERTMIVSLSFDDTFSEHVDAAHVLERYGMRGTFYVNSTRLQVFDVDYMTTAQVQALAAAGHEIGGHTLTHKRLTDLDAETARHEVCDDRQALVGAGFDVRTFAYPFGACDDQIQQLARDCGYSAARKVGGTYDETSCKACPYGESLPPKNALNIVTADSFDATDTLDSMKEVVIHAEEHGAAWLPLVFHHICVGCNASTVAPETFEAFVAWLAERRQPVRTINAMSTSL